MPGTTDIALHWVQTLDEAMALKRWLGERRPGGWLAVDTESTGLDWWRDRLRTVQFGDRHNGWCIEWSEWAGLVKECLRDYEGPQALWNIKHDLHFMEYNGIAVKRWLMHDGRAMEHLQNPWRLTGLKPTASRRLGPWATYGEQELKAAKLANGWDWATTPIEAEWQYACVPTDTQILTRQGWVQHTDLGETSETLGLGANGKLEWTPILGQVANRQEVLKLDRKTHAVEGTRHHRWLISSEADPEPKFRPLSDGWNSRSRLHVAAEYEGGKSELTADDAALIGWLVTDGYVYWGPEKKQANAVISQKKYRKEIKELLHRVGAYVSERKASNAESEVYLYTVKAAYVRDLWARAALHTRSLLSLIPELSEEVRKAFILAARQAEGVASLDRVEIAQNHGPVSDAIALALALDGYRTHTREKRGRDGAKPHGTVCGNTRAITGQKSTWISLGEQDVWCPTTGNGSWLAKDRHGNIFLTGNSFDTVITAQTFEEIYPGIASGYASIYDLELASTMVLTDMERRGIMTDRGWMVKHADEWQQNADQIALKLRDYYIGNPASDKQVIKALQDFLGWRPVVFTEKGNISLEREVLQGIQHPLADLVLEYRTNTKLQQYVTQHLDLAGPDGLLHCSINPLGARTGRTSASRPNLQNLPADDKRIRKGFVSRQGNVLISADYDQIEGRLFAHFSGDEKMLQSIRYGDEQTALGRPGYDMHSMAARLVFSLGLDVEVPKPLRQQVKGIQFGKLFGAGLEKFMAMSGLNRDEASARLAQYEETFPQTRKDGFQSRITQRLYEREKQTGEAYVMTPYGRKEPCWPSQAYKAVNYLIQGTAADVMKDRMVALSKTWVGEHMLLTIHDEFLFDVPEGAVYDAVRTIRQVMPENERFAVPLSVDVEVMRRWGEEPLQMAA